MVSPCLAAGGIGADLAAIFAAWCLGHGAGLDHDAFLFVLVLFTYRQQVGDMAQNVSHEVIGANDQRAEGQSLHIRMDPDGHFWARGEINGTPARFLIDSGATITALSDDVAREAGLACC